jgi:hypothetical protein
VTKAPKLALFFGISALGCSIVLLNHFNLVKTLVLVNGSTNLIFHLQDRWFVNRHAIIDNGIDSIIIFFFWD